MKRFKTTRIAHTVCRNCGHRIDSASGFDAKPMEGSLMVCIVCGDVSIWEKNALRPLSGDEVVEVAGDPDLVAFVNAVAVAKKAYEADNPGRRWGEKLLAADKAEPRGRS